MKEIFIDIRYEDDVNGNPRFSVQSKGNDDQLFTMFLALSELPEMRAAMTEAVYSWHTDDVNKSN